MFFLSVSFLPGDLRVVMADVAPEVGARTPFVTCGLIGAAIAATLLVQTQRVSPATLALSPGPPWEQDLWRPLSCLLYSDGFTLGFAIRLILLARYSSTLETTAFASSGLHYLGVVCLGVALMIGAIAHRPAELAQPYLLTALCFFMAYLAKRLPWEKPPGRHGFWAVLIVMAGVSGAAAALAQMVGVGCAASSAPAPPLRHPCATPAPLLRHPMRRPCAPNVPAPLRPCTSAPLHSAPATVQGGAGGGAARGDAARREHGAARGRGGAARGSRARRLG